MGVASGASGSRAEVAATATVVRVGAMPAVATVGRAAVDTAATGRVVAGMRAGIATAGILPMARTGCAAAMICPTHLPKT